MGSGGVPARGGRARFDRSRRAASGRFAWETSAERVRSGPAGRAASASTARGGPASRNAAACRANARWERPLALIDRRRAADDLAPGVRSGALPPVRPEQQLRAGRGTHQRVLLVYQRHRDGRDARPDFGRPARRGLRLRCLRRAACGGQRVRIARRPSACMRGQGLRAPEASARDPRASMLATCQHPGLRRPRSDPDSHPATRRAGSVRTCSRPAAKPRPRVGGNGSPIFQCLDFVATPRAPAAGDGRRCGRSAGSRRSPPRRA